MSKIKTVFWGFFSLDYKAMAEFLEKKAEGGWMLEKLGRFTARFIKIEPQRIKYYVDVFPGKGFLDSGDPELLDYRSLCEESGWHYITAQARLQIYYAYDEENPIPIQTDKDIEHKIVQSTLLKNEMISLAISFSSTILLLMIAVDYDYTNLLSFSGVAMMFAFPLSVLVICALGIHIIAWMIKARNNIKKGLAIPKSKLKTARLRSKAFFGAYFMIALIWIGAIIGDLFSGHSYIVIALFPLIIGGGAGFLIKKCIIKRKVENKKKAIVVGVILGAVIAATIPITMLTGFMLMDVGNNENDELPNQYPTITLKDIYGKEFDIKVSRFDKGRSPIVPKHFDYYEIAKERKGSISTEYYLCINEYFAKVIYNGKLENEQRYNEMIYEPGSDWNADEMIYMNDYQSILLRKGKKVIFIDGDEDLREKKIKSMIQSKLLGENSD